MSTGGKAEAVDQSTSHAALMNDNYRYQRLVYDATRRFYLLGRDHLIANLQVPISGSVLEIACGTGRNLALIGRRFPGCQLYGLDISTEMLITARAKLGGRAMLAQGDACAFDAKQMFGIAVFDRIVLSYCLSMIPDWTAALSMAGRHLAPGGQMYVVDFGNQSGLPRWFGNGLRGWLAKFHVSPRDGLADALHDCSAGLGGETESTPLFRSYAQYAVVRRPL